jgi:hypothetical protein
MEHFERLHVHLALGAQVLEAVEEVLARQLVAKDAQLQRPGLPGLAHLVGRAQDDLVHRRAERVLGRGHVLGRDAERLGIAVDVGEKCRHVVGKSDLVLRAAAVLEQEQRIEAFVHDVHQALRRTLGRQAGLRGHPPFGEGAHAATAISSRRSSRIPLGT